MHTVYREYERRKAAARRDRLRGRARARDPALRDATSRRAPTCATATAPSRSTSTRTSTCSSRRCSTCGSAPRDDLCVVGDDYQSIYAFTGASPRWLLGVRGAVPERDRRAAGGELPLDAAGARAREPARAAARRRREGAARDAADGPEPVLRPFATAGGRGRVARGRARAARGRRACRSRRRRSSAARTRAWPTSRRCCTRRACRSRARRCSARDAARRLLRLLDRDGSTGVAGRVRALALEAGWLEQLPDKLGDRELTRQADLARLVKLAEELDDGELTCAGFAAELRRRFDPGGEGARGVHLLTYHRAKGLEFDAVFLPRLDEKELPSRLARTDGRAGRGAAAALRRDHAREAAARAHVVAAAEPVPRRARRRDRSARRRRRRAPSARRGTSRPAAEALRRWRLERARADSVPPYVIFPDRTIDELLARRPSSPAELAAIHGLGPARLARFGDELFAVLQQVVSARRGPAGRAGRAAPRPRRRPPPPPPPSRRPAATRRSTTRSRPGAARRAADEDVPAFHVFANRVLAAIAEAKPRLARGAPRRPRRRPGEARALRRRGARPSRGSARGSRPELGPPASRAGTTVSSVVVRLGPREGASALLVTPATAFVFVSTQTCIAPSPSAWIRRTSVE